MNIGEKCQTIILEKFAFLLSIFKGLIYSYQNTFLNIAKLMLYLMLSLTLLHIISKLS